jgi:hypothetical protein
MEVHTLRQLQGKMSNYNFCSREVARRWQCSLYFLNVYPCGNLMCIARIHPRQSMRGERRDALQGGAAQVNRSGSFRCTRRLVVFGAHTPKRGRRQRATARAAGTRGLQRARKAVCGACDWRFPPTFPVRGSVADGLQHRDARSTAPPSACPAV